MHIVDSAGLFRPPGQMYHLNFQRVMSRYYFIEHGHRGFCEFVYTEEGQFEHVINDTPFIQKSGQMVLVRERDIHSLHGKNFTMTNTAFPLSWFGELVRLWHSGRWLDDLLAMPFPPVITLPPAKRAQFAGMQEELLKHRNASTGRAFFSRYLITIMLETVLPQCIPGSPGERYPAWLKDLLTWVSSRQPPPKTVQVVEKSRRCREHVSRSFRKYLGLSLSQYLNGRRLSTAADMLAGTNFPVLEVCYAAGFENPGYFYRLFKSRYAVTPENYRKKNSAASLLPGAARKP